MTGGLRFSTVRQLSALDQLRANDVPADAEQSRRLNLIAMTKLIGRLGDCVLNLGV